MNYNEIEILAPVGSFESLSAAIQAGADSIYFGIENLNMRSRSSKKFTINDIYKISSICKENNVRTYITLNTIIYDNDIELLTTIIKEVKKAEINAIIATDHSVLSLSRQYSIPVHASTQINISNLESVKFFSNFCDVMVLARELSLEQIKYITTSIKKQKIIGPSGNLVSIEVFIHGALCMAISGKCFLSQHTHNASANRGACYQNCRRNYKIIDDQGTELIVDNNYILSPKDLNTIGFLDKIIQSGVKFLKIEGRGRSAEYVYTVVSCYKEAILAIHSGKYNQSLIDSLNQKLSGVFNRGFWEGHYLGKKISDWNSNTYGSKTTFRKEYLGKGVKYFKQIKVAEFVMESGILSVGDIILVIGPTTGVLELKINELRKDDKSVYFVSKGDHFSIPSDSTIRNSDSFYKKVPQIILD